MKLYRKTGFMKGVCTFTAKACLLFLSSCVGYAPDTIDNKPVVKIDENLFGIWKAVEDTSQENYILIQSTDDVMYTVEEIRRDYGSVLKYDQAIDSFLGHSFGIDTVESIKSNREREEKMKPDREYKYWMTYFDAGGKNPHFQEWSTFVSNVAGSRFLNMNYWHDTSGNNEREWGYFFARLLKVSQDTIITTVVSDPIMRTLKGSHAVRSRIEKNINNKSFYRDTVHFYRVKRGHFGFNESIKLANK